MLSSLPMGPVERWSRIVVAAVGLGIVTVPVLLAMLLMWPSRPARIRLGCRYGHFIGTVGARVLGFRFDILGRERAQALMPAIYIINHTSALDLMLGLAMVPVGACAIAKKEMARVPFLGQAYLLSGHLLIDRSDKTKTIAAMDAVARDMSAHGLGAWIWPEGTRSPDGRLRPFKKGFVHLALATRLPIVPIAILDAPARWPARTLDFRPGTLQVAVLEPIETTDWSIDTVAEHAEQVRQVIAARLPAHQRPVNSA